jgi:multicomponent Na+:H+ antiporter subunit G
VKTLVVAVLLGIGALVSLSAAVGIVRLPDVYLRIQASAKMIIAGAFPVLVGIVVAMGIDTPYASRALIVAVLLVVMNPIASHVLARASYKAGIPMWKGAVVDQPAQRRDANTAHNDTRHPGPREAPDGGGAN